MSDSVISVENLGKRYRIRHQQQGGMRYKALRDVLADKTKGVVRRLWSTLSALQYVSFCPFEFQPVSFSDCQLLQDTPGSPKVIYGEGPACARRVSRESPWLPQSVLPTQPRPQCWPLSQY
jgi:hypothetical protein